MLEKISPINKKQEEAIQRKLCVYIEKKNSAIFNAGAGAGKTYALVESLKHVLHEFGTILKDNNQYIICITYTKVASEEVRLRIGSSSIVKISTIHERIWELISPYQNELVEIHKEYLEEQIKTLQEQIKSDKRFSSYQELEFKKKEKFLNCMEKNKEVYYQNYNKGANDFRNALQNVIGNWDTLLKSKSNFIKIVDTLFKIQNYKRCVKNIEAGQEGYKIVKYNSIYNRDQLHKMRISHDTLLI